MDDFFDEVNVDLCNEIPRRTRKKMKKRRQLDALVKYSITKRKRTSPFDDVLLSSDDDQSFFLKRRKSRTRSIRSRLFSSIRTIFLLIFLIGFLFFCLFLSSTNLHLKNQIERLSSRLNRIEEKFSLNDSFTERLHFIEQVYRQISSTLQFVQIQNRIENEFVDLRSQIQRIHDDFLRFPSNETLSIFESFQSTLDEVKEKINQCRCSSLLSNETSILNFL